MKTFEVYEKTCEEMQKKGLAKRECVLSATYCYTYGILAPLPIMIILGGIYFIRWGGRFFSIGICCIY